MPQESRLQAYIAVFATLQIRIQQLGQHKVAYYSVAICSILQAVQKDERSAEFAAISNAMPPGFGDRWPEFEAKLLTTAHPSLNQEAALPLLHLKSRALQDLEEEASGKGIVEGESAASWQNRHRGQSLQYLTSAVHTIQSVASHDLHGEIPPFGLERRRG